MNDLFVIVFSHYPFIDLVGPFKTELEAKNINENNLHLPIGKITKIKLGESNIKIGNPPKYTVMIHDDINGFVLDGLFSFSDDAKNYAKQKDLQVNHKVQEIMDIDTYLHFKTFL